MKKIILCICSVFCVIQIHAQLAVRVGYNIPTVSTNLFSEEVEASKGFQLGLSFTDEIGSNFHLRPGLLYSRKGFIVDLGQGNSTFIFNYMEIPLDLLYASSFSDDFVMKTHAGLYYGVMLNGSNEINGDKTTLDFGDGFFKRGDLGFNIGMTFEFTQIYIGWNYGLGLSQINADMVDTNKNKVLSLIGGYIF